MRAATVLGVCLVLLVSSVGCGETKAAYPEEAAVSGALRVLDQLEQGKYGDVRDRFDEKLRAEYSAEEIANGWKAFEKLKGAFRSQGRTEVVESRGFTVVAVELDMQREDGQLRVSFDKEGKIGGFFFFDAGEPVPEF